jgi:hypothetical protein
MYFAMYFTMYLPIYLTMNMKKINDVWHICRDGWIFELATKAEVISHVFNGMAVKSFDSVFNNT